MAFYQNNFDDFEPSGAEEGALGRNEMDPNIASENDPIQQLLKYERIRAESNQAPRADQALHTIIIVDTSGSMDGEPLIEAGRFISQFISGLVEIQFECDLSENVALISVGEEIQVVQHFTNDYSLIRRATDTLTASGSSRLHMGLILPSSVLSTSGQGGIYHMGDHIVYPRIIFISDGNLNLVDDMPGQLLNPDDQVLTNLQNLCLDLTQKMTESTMSKIYCVPVGNANMPFLEILSQCSGGKLTQPTRAKHMSRCLLHHVVLKRLNDNGKQIPTRDEVAEILNQITVTAEEDDINGVCDLIDLSVTQKMIPGSGRDVKQGLDTMTGSYAQPFIDRDVGTRPKSRGRGRPGGVLGREGHGVGGLGGMLGMAGGKVRAGGYERDVLNGFGRGMNIGLSGDSRRGGRINVGNGTGDLFSLDGLMNKVGKGELNKTDSCNDDRNKKAPLVMEGSGQGSSGQSKLEALLGKPLGLSFQSGKNVLSPEENGGQGAEEIDGDLGLIHDSSDQSMLDIKDGDIAVGTKSGSENERVRLGLQSAGADEPLLGLIESNELNTKNYERGKLNTVSPCSFGVVGNAYNIDPMDDNEGNKGNKLIKKLGAWLGFENESNDGCFRNFQELLRFGQEGLMEGGSDSHIPDLGNVPQDIEALFQNLIKDSRVQNDDGDAIIKDTDSEIDERSNRNVRMFGKGNRKQQPASFLRGFGLPAGGAPNRLQQFQQLWQNSKGDNLGMAHLTRKSGQLNMDRQVESDNSGDDNR